MAHKLLMRLWCESVHACTKGKCEVVLHCRVCIMGAWTRSALRWENELNCTANLSSLHHCIAPSTDGHK
eukprot:1117635-Pelagomonas_calceolata.AAC.1